MAIKVLTRSILKYSGDVLIVNLFEGVKTPSGATGAADRALNGAITRSIARGEISGKLGETMVIHTLGKMPVDKVVVVGLGPADSFRDGEIRKASASAILLAQKLRARKVGTIVHGAGVGGIPPETAARALTEGTLLALYEFTEYKKNTEPKIDEITVIENDPGKAKKIVVGILLGSIVAESQNIARDLTNFPANDLTPERFDKKISEILKRFDLQKKILQRTYGPKDIEKLKMNALLSVSKGSDNPPRFIVLKYGQAAKPKVCLIGKAVTFDSGGISIKPSEGMSKMKGDMSGGGVVVATLVALARANIKTDAWAIVPAVENLPSGRASRPGDVVKAMNGKTIEIISTDAEGRMTLADALCYAEKNGAGLIVDIATLTGASMVAFGDVTSAVMGNDQPTVDRLLDAARAAGERMWQLPLFEEYDDKVKSDIADLKNAGTREGGAITAGVFLSAFVKKARWVHIDIAGREIAEREKYFQPRGGTGHGVRTLFEFCRNIK
jgi:leucyl aminopeptidase